jgi:hypothetical protein
MEDLPASAAGPPLEPRRGAFAFLRGGWGTAVLRALLTALVLGVLAEGLSFLLYTAAGGSRPSKVDFARIGGGIFFAFHRVGFVFEVPRSAVDSTGASTIPFPFPFSARFTVSLAIMGGTALAMVLLYWGGRAVARAGGGDEVARAIHGAKIGVPYAVACLIGAWGVRFAVPFAGGSLRIHPSYLAAGLWPLGLGVLMGGLGGLRAESDAWTGGVATDRWTRRPRAAVAGGWRMLALGLLLSFAGLLVLAAAKPSATRAYFRGAFEGGAERGAAAVASNVLVVPNMAAWVLFPSMGSCLGVSGGSFGVQGSVCFLSYTRFPTGSGVTDFIGRGGLEGLPGPPPAYYAFVLVPLIAVLYGGAVAARRASARSKSEAAAMGALAGIAFGLMAVLALVLSIVTVRAGGQVGSLSEAVTVRFGPDLARSTLLAFAWGVVGGGLGGLVHGRGLALTASRREEPPAPGSIPLWPGWDAPTPPVPEQP